MTIEVPDDLFEQLADRISEKLWQRREDARIGFMKVDEAAAIWPARRAVSTTW